MENTNPTTEPVVPSVEAVVEPVAEEAKSKNMPMMVLAALCVVAVGTSVYFYKQLAVLKQDPQKVAQQEATVLVEKVSKLIVLPTGEQPTIATVTDPEKLKSQPFFVNAKTGDKVLIYTNAKKAFLYNPVENRLVEVAPLSIGNPQ